MESQSQFVLVVDTDRYAGNFERELGAYCVGEIGECGVGQEWADDYAKEETYDFGDIVEDLPDEYSCYRPVKLVETPGFFNDGVGNVWPEDTAPALVKDKYYSTLHSEEYEHYEPLEIESLRTEGPGHFNAFYSVGIIFSHRPTQEEIDIIKRRAAIFCETKWPEQFKRDFDVETSPIKIIGFRLLEEKLVVIEQAV